jgi:hypothetical protein
MKDVSEVGAQPRLAFCGVGKERGARVNNLTHHKDSYERLSLTLLTLTLF